MKKRNLFFAVGLTTLASITLEKTLRKKDKPLEAYGQKVRVFGKYLSTEIIGNGEHVIALYPGACETSPILSYKALAKYLSEYFTVVTIEPFGYGASSPTNHTRSVENLSEELHQAMKALGYSKYSICMHSAGGIVGMALAIKYPEEIETCLCLDTTPAELTDYTSSTILEKVSGHVLKGMNKLGLSRLLHKTNKLTPKVNGYLFTEQDKDAYFKCTLENGFSKNMQEELEELDPNLRSMQGKKYPNSIPVYSFVSSETDKLLTKFSAPLGKWIALHQSMSSHPDSKVEVLNASHYLHHDEPETIAKEYINWFKTVTTK